MSRRGKRLQAEAGARLQEQTAREHASLLRGLVWVGVILLLLSLLRAGVQNVFIPGWWREW